MRFLDLVVGQMRGRTLVFVVSGVLCALLLGSALASDQTADSRPRRSNENARPIPSPTAIPTPAALVQTTPNRAKPTPTPRVPATDRIAPMLGDPPPAPRLKPTPTPTPPEEIDPESVLRFNAELVQLHVRVIDRNNKPIDNVPQNEFHVFEDGVPQPVEYFTREEVPISYGLAVDTSGSLRSQLQSVIDAGKTIVNSNKAGDETFLVRFISSDNIETVQDFTPSKDLLMDGLDELYIQGGQTAIIDAVYLTAEHVAEYKKGDDNDRRRRALIVITDGEDRSSIYSQEKLFARLREEDVQIYVICFVRELDKAGGLIRNSLRHKAVNLINKLASETGGRAFLPESLSELPRIADEIVRDLRTQYVVSYNPTNKSRDGSFRSIKVVVDDGAHDKHIALTRNGRIAPKGEPPAVKLPAIRNKPAVGTNKKP